MRFCRVALPEELTEEAVESEEVCVRVCCVLWRVGCFLLPLSAPGACIELK